MLYRLRYVLAVLIVAGALSAAFGVGLLPVAQSARSAGAAQDPTIPPTNTPRATALPTNTPRPTVTHTPAPTATETPLPSATPLPTATLTPSVTPSPTATEQVFLPIVTKSD